MSGPFFYFVTSLVGPFKLLLVVIGVFTAEPPGFTGVFKVVLGVLLKGNFLSDPCVAVLVFGF